MAKKWYIVHTYSGQENRAKQALLERAQALGFQEQFAEILIPEEFMGEVIGDLNSRQGKIDQIANNGPVQVLSASVPLSKMFGYSTSLRSLSQGRGTFSMQFSHYDRT